MAPPPPPTDEDFRQSEERFRLLVSSIRDYAIFMLDAQGRVQTWNAGALAIKGWSATEIIGQSIEVFYTEEDRKAGKPQRLLAEAAAMDRVEDEGWRVRKDGTTFWASVVITALKDAVGRVIGYAKVSRDLTERRRAEQLRLELAQAQEALRLRDDFLAIASHELKTPLTVMHATLVAIRRQLKDPAQQTRFERAVDASLKLSALVDSLLDVTAMAGGRLQVDRVDCDLSEIVRGAADAFKPSAVAHGCAFTAKIEGPAPGRWDPVRLGQVVTSLLGNAARFGAQAPIDLELKLKGDDVVLSVRDFGPGIPEDDRERVFGRFDHAKGLRDWGGMGLGLYAARQIVEAHGGTIVAKEAAGGGALLVVKLPRGEKG